MRLRGPGRQAWRAGGLHPKGTASTLDWEGFGEALPLRVFFGLGPQEHGGVSVLSWASLSAASGQPVRAWNSTTAVKHGDRRASLGLHLASGLAGVSGVMGQLVGSHDGGGSLWLLLCCDKVIVAGRGSVAAASVKIIRRKQAE